MKTLSVECKHEVKESITNKCLNHWHLQREANEFLQRKFFLGSNEGSIGGVSVGTFLEVQGTFCLIFPKLAKKTFMQQTFCRCWYKLTLYFPQASWQRR